MKNKFYYTISFLAFLVLFNACQNKQPTPPKPHGDKLPPNLGPKPIDTTTISSASFDAWGCLEGREIKASGKIILENGKPPVGYEIHLVTSIDGQPIVVAKGLTFNPDGSFKFRGNLPKGLPQKWKETGGNIFIAFGTGRASIYTGDCMGREEPELVDHSVFDKKDTSESKDIEIRTSNEKNPNKGDKKPKPKPKPAPRVTQYENGTIKLKGKTVTLENLRKELQAVLLTYKVIPNKVPRVSVGEVGMGMRQEVETIINESIAGAKWKRKKAALEKNK
jgi:hypothetical protein